MRSWMSTSPPPPPPLRGCGGRQSDDRPEEDGVLSMWEEKLLGLRKLMALLVLLWALHLEATPVLLLDKDAKLLMILNHFY